MNAPFAAQGTYPAFDDDPCVSLDRAVAGAREELGEQRWAELQREWRDGEVISHREHVCAWSPEYRASLEVEWDQAADDPRGIV